MFDEESSRIRKQQKFLQDVEHAVAEANRQAIHARIARLDRASFVAFAARVAGLRASYLEAALAASAGGDFSALQGHREAFEEAKAAFAALERAIERGYVDIADAG